MFLSEQMHDKYPELFTNVHELFGVIIGNSKRNVANSDENLREAVKRIREYVCRTYPHIK